MQCLSDISTLMNVNIHEIETNWFLQELTDKLPRFGVPWNSSLGTFRVTTKYMEGNMA